MHHLAKLETELRLMHHSAKARRLSLVVASPGRARNLSSGGATSWLERLHLPALQPWRLHLLAGAVAPPNPTAQAVAPPGWGGCTSQPRSPGGGTSRLERLHLSTLAVAPPGWRGGTSSLFQLTWFGSKLGPNQSELGPNWPLLGL